ncbi:MAG: Arginase [Phycisphaerae bacterium]|nr:Arginase [Phycisphaerae bacterium]
MQPRQVRIIGAPLDLGAGHRGVDMGPSAIRIAGVQRRLQQLGHTVRDGGDIETGVFETLDAGDPSLRFFEPVLDVNLRLARAVEQALETGEFPLVLGGDHSIAIGSVAGAASHHRRRGAAIGALWIDAHGDMNTPDTTPSGNIHGMGLAVALGLGNPDFVNLHAPGPKVRPEHVALVGVRDLDPGERRALKENHIRVFTMRDIDQQGMSAVMRQAIDVVTTGTAGVYVQFDMDVIDPATAPGTGTPVPGGLSYREAHLVMEMLAERSDRVVALDIVETNPALDTRNTTAELATELILSLMGKAIYAP